jgi:hypothetical protein
MQTALDLTIHPSSSDVAKYRLDLVRNPSWWGPVSPDEPELNLLFFALADRLWALAPEETKALNQHRW